MQSIAAVILAAGGSSRLGSSKQLAQLGGKTFVRRIVDAALDADCSPLVLVIGSHAAKIKADLPRAVMVVENKNWQQGIGTSIRCGVQHLVVTGVKVDAVLLLACDQPFVDANVLKNLIAHARQAGKGVVASRYSDTLGVPALFTRSLFADLLTLDGDTGAKKFILENPARVAEFLFPEGKIDIDTRRDYEKLDVPKVSIGA